MIKSGSILLILLEHKYLLSLLDLLELFYLLFHWGIPQNKYGHFVEPAEWWLKYKPYSHIGFIFMQYSPHVCVGSSQRSKTYTILVKMAPRCEYVSDWCVYPLNTWWLVQVLFLHPVAAVQASAAP